MIVLDTNVLSETLRPNTADSVKRWIEAQPPDEPVHNSHLRG